MLDIGIQVKLDGQNAQQQADLLWNRLVQIQTIAANIKLGNGTQSQASTAALEKQVQILTRYIQVLAASGVGSKDLANATQLLTATMNGNTQAVVVQIQNLQRLVAAQNQATQGNRAAVPAVQAHSSAVNALWGNLLRAGGAYLSFQAAMRVGSEIIEARIELDRLQIGMKAIAPNAEVAATAEAFLIARSNELGLSIRTTIPEFIKMNAAFTQSGFTFKQTEQIFTDVSTATIALGLSSATVSRILYDFQEMASLGTVQMRQMRQVMMQIPGGMEIAARSIGVTTEKLHELIHTGRLDPATFIPAFTHELANTFGKELPEATDRLEAHINRLKNAWMLMLGEMGKSPGIKWVFDATTMALQMLTPNSLEQERIQSERRRLTLNSQSRQAGGSLAGYMGASIGVELNPQSYISDEEIRSQLALQDRLNQQRRNRVSGGGAEPLQKWKPDLDEKEQEKVDSYWKEYRSLMSETLDDEAEKRQRIADNYLQAMDKFAAAFRKGDIDLEMYEKLAGAANSAMNFQQDKLAENLATAVARKQGDEMQSLNRLSIGGMPSDMVEKLMRLSQSESNAKFSGNSQAAQDAEDTMKKIIADWTKLHDIQKNLDVEIISDDQSKRVAKVNQEFDELKQTLEAIRQGGNIAVPQSAFDDAEKARKAALKDLVQKKDPTNYLTQSGSSLLAQREDLKRQLMTAGDVEDFKKITNQIESISEAMRVRLQNNAFDISDSFKIGFQEVAESWGSGSQRMARIGGTLANSLDQNLTGALSSIADGTKSPEQAFKQMALSIVDDMIRVITEVAVVQPLLQAIGISSGGTGGDGGAGSWVSLLGGALSSFIGVGGGFNSASGANSVGSIDAGTIGGGTTVMAGAGHHGLIVPRYHAGGVIGDEIPIVARKGEGIFTPEQMKALGAGLGGGGTSSKQIHILNLSDPRQVEKEINANPDMILNVISKNASTVRQLIG